MAKKIAVLLAGCGVYDGSEIHEATLSLYFIAQMGMTSVCFAPDREQFHVINHLSGKEEKTSRNILVESARIARGQVQPLQKLDIDSVDALLIPGGFGAAKNLNQWALHGSEGKIFPDVEEYILKFVQMQKPIVALCMGPTVVAKALEKSAQKPLLTVGTSAEKSPYDIAAISKGMQALGAATEMKSVREICVDERNKIISAPCYMMETDIAAVGNNVQLALEALQRFL